MTATLIKLAFAGIRARLLASALTVLLAGAAAATIVLALEVGATVRDPWQRTFDAANGADVLALVPSQADARAIAALPGSVTPSAPVPSAFALVADGGEDRLQLMGLATAPRVNAPVPTEGAAPRDGGIVLERSFAETLDLPVGAQLPLATERGTVQLRVVGTAISSASRAIRVATRAWPGRRARRSQQIEPDRGAWHWTQALRLADRATAPAFAAAPRRSPLRAARRSRPGRTSARTPWPTSHRWRSSSRPTRSCCSSWSSRSWRSSSARAPARSTARSGC